MMGSIPALIVLSACGQELPAECRVPPTARLKLLEEETRISRVITVSAEDSTAPCDAIMEFTWAFIDTPEDSAMSDVAFDPDSAFQRLAFDEPGTYGIEVAVETDHGADFAAVALIVINE